MITTSGKITRELIKKNGLIGFYNEYMGNVIIPERKFSDPVKNRVLSFLANNTGWVLGFEGDYYYLTSIENL